MNQTIQENIEAKTTTPVQSGPQLTRRDVIKAVGGLAVLGSTQMLSGATAEKEIIPKSLRSSILYPHEGPTRSTRNLSGMWQFKLDPKNEGERSGWYSGLTETRSIPVPASWNDIFDDARNYFDVAWYETEFFVDSGWRDQRIHLRFGAANYRAKVWLNGQLLGEHLGSDLPFAFEVTGTVKHNEANRLLVLVENTPRQDRLPAGEKPKAEAGVPSMVSQQPFPNVHADAFTYAGLHRPVLLFSTPVNYIVDVTVRTSFAGPTGIVDVDFAVDNSWSGSAEIVVESGDGRRTTRVSVQGGHASGQIRIPSVRLWGPSDPFLYRLSVRLGDGEPIDEYRLKIGVRTIEVAGERLLLNGQPVFLKGFCNQEDFPIHGRGLDMPVIVRDFELMKWIGANSFRSHYPYPEEAMILADEYGFLMIDETANHPFFSGPAETVEARRSQHAQALGELIARDKNHPSVIMWCVCNEPFGGLSMLLSPGQGSLESNIAAGVKYLQPLFDYTRKTDPSRLVVLVAAGPGPDEWVGLGDIICTDLYYGWYSFGGQLQDAARGALEAALNQLHEKHKKPIIVTEFGAVSIAGVHSQPADMYSEEYQAEMLEMYFRTFSKYDYVVGGHPYTFADYRTPQAVRLPETMNPKGVFTRDRRPKYAAHRLRELWQKA